MFIVVLAVLVFQSHAARPKRNNVARGAGNNLMDDLDTPRPTTAPPREDGRTEEEGADGESNPACGTCVLDRPGQTGCSVQAIEDCVCGNDEYCCTVEWDDVCVEDAFYCDSTCFLDEGQGPAMNCGVAHLGQGCEVPAIEDCVCSSDPYCCDTEWDGICVSLVWESPCYIDCDCLESNEDYRGGSRLPSYWEALADARNINTSLLGFNVAAGKWCYDLSNTCVKWGEGSGACDDSSFACGGRENTPPTIGYGSEQMDLIATMISMGDHEHYLCPACTNTTTCPSGASRGTDNESAATFTDCDCVGHHTGVPLINGGYWWTVASNAGLYPSVVSQRAGHWYYNGTRTCVAMGSYGDSCVGSDSVCAGGNQYGTALDQMMYILEANNDGGVHPNCPM